MTLPGVAWAESALVVVDMQNDFVRVGAPMEVPTARAVVPVIDRLAATFRSRGRPVIFTRFIAGPRRTLMWEWTDAHRHPVCCCWRRHPRYYSELDAERFCADVVDELAPRPEDYVVDKYGYDAFHNTPLQDILAAEGCRAIVVTGAVTQICVDSTVRGAVHRGVACLVCRDAVASPRADLHSTSLAVLNHKFAWVADSRDILDRLER